MDDNESEHSGSVVSLEPESSNGNVDEPPEAERDEVREVRKMSQKDTALVRRWRFAVTGMLLITAIIITVVSYTLLNDQEMENFAVAFDRNSRTVGDASVEHQRIIRQSFQGMEDLIASYAMVDEKGWPFHSVDLFELHAHDLLELASLETLAFVKVVKSEDQEDYLEHAGQTYEGIVKESHEIRHGNLDSLIPENYHPYFTIRDADGYTRENTTTKRSHNVLWQVSPPMQSYDMLNWDVDDAIPRFDKLAETIEQFKNESLVTPIQSSNPFDLNQNKTHNRYSFFVQPLHLNATDKHSEIVAFLCGAYSWDIELNNLLPTGVNGIIAEIHNSCNQVISYRIDGPEVHFLGEGSKHESKYNSMEVVRKLTTCWHPDDATTLDHCIYYIHIYPSAQFEDHYNTKTPETFAAIVAVTFGLVVLVFYVYDIMVQRRNDKLVYRAAQSNAIVSDLFPDAIRDRILEQNNANADLKHKNTFIDGKQLDAAKFVKLGNVPVAELYPDATVIFADIVGFTAWSSVREPSQVFTLLETVYGCFDSIAKRRRIFKVETVGDCYVAVSGLPTPRKDHAVAACRFVRDILEKMNQLTKSLEVTLGPDTGDLTLRIGVHSGPVTGGVLRGARSRFQLFGDTMNTTARIETTGEAGRIHISQETANLLISADKQSWIHQREQVVFAKGKGSMQTYWLTSHKDRSEKTSSDGTGTHQSGSNDLSEVDNIIVHNTYICRTDFSERMNRLIDWNVGQLLSIVKKIVAHRMASSQSEASSEVSIDPLKVVASPNSNFPIDEVQEIIRLPDFDGSVSMRRQDPETVEISPVVIEQLTLLVIWIARHYNDNPFHNFDHCSHVMMSVIKLMSRIISPSELHYHNDMIKRGGSGSGETSNGKSAASLHDHTYGITSDPLTQFACAYSALIHDLDHSGVPNSTLVAENSPVATQYNNRSVAEQNSFDLSWAELMGPQYAELRQAIFVNDADQIRFRQLVVNCVMATDIVDKDLKTLRNQRWDKAFKKSMDPSDDQNPRDSVNRKATIVIEHLIQASDVSHTMQHWHVFRKWNMNLFEEMYAAYVAGRSEKDPSDFWYEGEIGFFDFYIIPLAKKLKECGVFGVSSDEYLNYATKNRNEWEARGKEIVAEMVESVRGRVLPSGNGAAEK